MRRKLNTFIFDLDGTLVDSAPAQYGWYKHLAQREGVQLQNVHNVDDFLALQLDREHISLDGNGESLYEKLGFDCREENFDKWDGWYKEFKSKQVMPLIEGRKEILDDLHYLGRATKSRPRANKLGILTNNEWEGVEPSLLHAEVMTYFSAVVAANHLFRFGKYIARKPNPTAMYRVMEHLDNPALSGTAFFGDTDDDVNGVHAYNEAHPHADEILIVGISDGKYQSEKKLAAARPHELVKDSSELRALLRDLGAF